MLVFGTLLGPFAGAAHTTQPEADVVTIDVIEVSGLLDPISIDFMTEALEEAGRDGVEVLVIRMDSPGSVVPAEQVGRLAARFRRSKATVAIWIGPGRQSGVAGGAYTLFRAAPLRGMAPGSSAGPLRAEVALARGLATVPAATLGDFIIGLDGQRTPAGRVLEIPTTVVHRPGHPPQRQLAAEARVRFDEPSLLAQLLHAVATPSASYLLLAIGLLLVVFEFYTAGVGVAGVVGAAALVLAGYGLGVLPTRPASLAALVLGILGYAIDVQAGAPRAWTVLGTVGVVAGSFFLFAGVEVPLVVVALVVAGIALFMVAGMPAMVRARFSTPTIGRESMLGEEGTALSDVDPEGVVTVREAPWRARTNRATPIRAGEAVKVAGINGLLLEVEPLQGAARDAGH